MPLTERSPRLGERMRLARGRASSVRISVVSMTSASPTALTRQEIVRWRNTVLVVFTLCGLGFASWAARVPLIASSLGLSSGQVGVLLFGGAVGSIVGLAASGHLVAIFGAPKVMLVTLLVAPVGLFVGAAGATVLESFALTFASLALYGACIGTCDVAMNVSGAANERALGASIVPVFHGFFSIGTIVGAALGALAEFLGIPLALHIAVIGAVMIAAILSTIRFAQSEDHDAEPATTEAPHEPSTWRTRLSIWHDPRTIMIGLIVLGMAFAEGSANDWLAYAMVHGHNTDAPTGALIFGVFVTAMTVGRLSGVKLLDRFGRVPVLRWSAVLAVVGLLMLIFIPIVWLAVVGVVLWGLGAALGFPVGMSAAADDPRTAAARVSAVATIGYVAFLVGPPAIGALGDAFGILNGLLVVLILVAVAGAASSAARESAAAKVSAQAS